MRWLPIAFAVLLVGGVAALGTPRVAYACSSTENPFETLDVIVAGRVTDIARAPELDRLSPTGVVRAGEFVAIRVTFKVDQYLKGFGPTRLAAFDRNSAYYGDGPGERYSETDLDGLLYAGSSGSCGALDEDPRGQYRVAGFFRRPDGSLNMHIFGRFVIADSANDPAVARAIARVEEELTALGLPFPPSVGSAGLASTEDRGVPTPPLAALLLLVALAGAGTLRAITPSERRPRPRR